MAFQNRKGIPNRVGAEVKQSILDVFLQLGGVAEMLKWAKKNKTAFYRIYARLIPSEIVASLDVRDASELTDDELLRIIGFATGSGSGDAGEAAGKKDLPPIH